ncbi:Ku protein [Syntrophothermus lipocalidus]|uniref:Non-homologous end joining protein Ku n=1 Tax=Syntrophothermus lipocalidus (strain DSM 12680 / TGB-C1) TaxID=643648 RepID=D7CNI6_SYNLT|nr:Ku protein [Syntrophothermus lipocalidus]ADI02271.1 Ku protein [Syntrophothermus lipocalidus DSM 12680]
MRALWRGSISFGLVNVPVRMYAATERKSVSFRQIHRECGTPIRYEKVCPACNRKVEEDEIARGYEYEKGRFVIIEDKDLEAIPDETTRTIDIIDFVDLKEIDPVYFDHSYFLGPEETGQKAYLLLFEALRKTGKIAIAKVTIRAKQSLACLRPYGENQLVIETMFYPDEVRDAGEITVSPGIKLHENEIKMAVQLIDSLAAEFRPEKYTDEYRKALLDIIRAKVEGQEIKIPAPREEKVVDLMEALKASLAMVEEEKGKNRLPAGAGKRGPLHNPSSTRLMTGCLR